MSGHQTYVHASLSQTIVNNNTIVIASNCNDDLNTSSFCIKRYESIDNLPPPTHCSTPKAKGPKKTLSIQYDMCDPTPTSVWLDELKGCYFPECTTTLQSKSLVVDVNVKVELLASFTSKIIRTLHQQTYAIAKEFDHIYRCLENNCTKYIPSLVDDLITHMTDILLQHASGYLELDMYQAAAYQCEKFRNDELANLVWQLNSLALDFSKRIDRLLLRQMEVLISVIDTVDDADALMFLLNSLSSLGLRYDHLSSLLSRCDGVSTIVHLSCNSYSSMVRTTALKLLYAILCTHSAAISTSQGVCINKLCSILEDECKEELEKYQAMRIICRLSQIQRNAKMPILAMSDMVAALTRIIKETTCPQTLLLSAVSLANISKEKDSVNSFVSNSTLVVLLNAIRNQGTEVEIFLKEQAASIIANLSEHPEAIPHLCQNRVIPALLCFLNFELSNNVRFEDSPSYRLQHQCALALSRLCTEKEAVSQIEQFNGVPKLMKLCKYGVNESENDSRFLVSMDAISKILARSNTKNLPISPEVSRTKSSIMSH